MRSATNIPLVLRTVTVAFGSLLAACGESAGEKACRDLIGAIVDKVSDECEILPANTVRDSISAGLATVGIDGCEDVDRVGDKDEFYMECIPAIEGFTCDEASDLVTMGTLPGSCEGQLLVAR